MDLRFSSRPSDLVHLPEQVARDRFFDARNYRWLKAWSVSFTFLAIGYALWTLAAGAWERLWLPFIQLLVARAPFWAAERDETSSRAALLVYLFAQLGLVPFYLPNLAVGLRTLAFVAPVALLPFRLSVPVAVTLYCLPLLCNLGFELASGAGTSSPAALTVLALQAIVAALALFLNLSHRKAVSRAFLRDFQVESSRQRDRQRMREELDYARRIQLSMLPRSDPRLDTLEVTGISLPATEVGGDYYEYFIPGPSRFTIAVGDVAGHGVASGLLLSGIRSCLHLLQDEDPPPGQILQRLDKMVAETTDRRMFITLLVAAFDLDRRRLRVASAGHPPLLHLQTGSGSVEEIDGSAPPLGTRLGASFGEKSVDFSGGDLLVLYTDGLTELRGHRGGPYGSHRLARLLRHNAHKSCREIRETILGDLWTFKGDAEQLDDLTLVVVKVKKSSEIGRQSENRKLAS